MMEMLAFQIPQALSGRLQTRSHTSPRLDCIVNLRSLRQPAHPCPPSPPRPPPSNNFRRRNTVAAWLNNLSSDSVVLTAASRSTSFVVPIHGLYNIHHVIRRAISEHATHLYFDSHINRNLSQLCTTIRSSGLVPVPVNSVAPYAIPLPVCASAAVITAPILVERKGDSVVQFFDAENDKTSRQNTQVSLRPVKQIDERPWMERLSSWLTRVYLPHGYPHTTTPDYISFTRYRTIQNLASSIMQVISTEALLFGLGLGQKVAAGAAATSWVLKDGFSYFVKIGYGSLFGSKFDDDPKSWRIAADIVEDVAGAVEILTPLFGRAYFLPLASLAACLRGTSLMTGTATRHIIYRSLAAKEMQNTGDIATKGESQGVTCKMIGLASGIIISSKIGQKYYALLAAYSILAAVHVAANWKSVQCVQLSFLNKQRASILIDNHLSGKQMPSPYDVSHIEKIILPPWKGFDPAVKIGASVAQVGTLTPTKLSTMKKVFRGEHFLVISSSGSRSNDEKRSNDRHSILLRENASSMDALRAYYFVKYLRSRGLSNGQEPQQFSDALKYMKRHITSFKKEAKKSGWDTRHMLLINTHTRLEW